MALLFLIVGFGTVFLAKSVVEKYQINEKVTCNFEHEMTEEELLKYKYDKAVVNTKMAGMLIALPGLILIVMLFK